jgi:predicted dehydrogenase
MRIGEMTWRGAIIGCGYISQRQLWAWKQIKQAQIVAVCDLDEDRARQRAREFGIRAVHTDFRRLLRDPGLDFVDIATRPDTHPELVAAAAARGLHVLCQKPIAVSMEDALKMVAVCQKTGVTLMVNENARHQAWFRLIKVLLANGSLGKAYYARFEMRRRTSYPTVNFGDQPYFRKMTKLLVFEMGVHFLDIARYLFGEATAVYAQLRRISPHIAGEDMAVLMVDFPGLTCLVDTSWCSVTKQGPTVAWGPVRVEGTKGTVCLGEDGVLTLYTDADQRSWTFDENTYAQSFVATQRHFIECLSEGLPPETSGKETLKTMALVFAAYRSGQEERAIDVKEFYPDDYLLDS